MLALGYPRPLIHLLSSQAVKNRRMNTRLFIFILACLSLALAVRAGTDNDYPDPGISCQNLNVSDARTCSEWCGGGVSMTPTSLLYNNGTCSCLNCKMREPGQGCPVSGQTICFPEGMADAVDGMFALIYLPIRREKSYAYLTHIL